MFTANRNVSNSQLVHNGFYRLCHKETAVRSYNQLVFKVAGF